jgi:two-component system, NtrC family, sensor kinase
MIHLKFYTSFLISLIFASVCCAQEYNSVNQKYTDSLRLVLKNATHDSVRLANITLLAKNFELNKLDSTLYYSSIGLSIAQKSKQPLYEAVFLFWQAGGADQNGQYAAAFKTQMRIFEILQNADSEKNAYITASRSPHQYRLYALALAHSAYARLMTETENKEKALYHAKESLRFAKQSGDEFRIGSSFRAVANGYANLKMLDSAEVFALKSLHAYQKINMKRYLSLPLLDLASIYSQKKQYGLAKKYFNLALQAAISQENNNKRDLLRTYTQLSSFFLTLKNKDSSLLYSKKAYMMATMPEFANTQYINDGEVYQNLYESYLLNKNLDSAYKYQGLALATKNKWNKIKLTNLAELQSLLLTEAERLRALEKEQIQTQSNIRTTLFLIGLTVLSVIGFILYRNNRQKQKANLILKEQKDKVESTLSDLKSTQSQLIQSEKMASLGELTAGIAHEIQNPLNFVNNFSEVSNELIDEIQEERRKNTAERDEELVGEILNDIKQNLEKINHHGKRADAIVKGMLQHSRSTNNAVKEPTDINKLADEYLRLAYHGLRAKDKSFNATMKTEFDESIGTINIIPQDMGRVILNLITNAFYATNEKKKSPLTPEGGTDNYEPTVTVATKKVGDKVEVSVKDNGNGIPQKVLDKIFQPFFTTKPTGQGTGLGLSLSYDIVKSHGGELKVETIENEGTTFKILLHL